MHTKSLRPVVGAVLFLLLVSLFAALLSAAPRTQRWRPDTCPCEVIETWDPANPGAGVSFSSIVTKCPLHAAVSDAALYGVLQTNVDAENPRKNKVLGFMLATTSLNLTQVDAVSGEVVWKNGVVVNWSFNATRQLVISVTGVTLTNTQKNQIRSFCDTTFGVNKVIVN